MSLDLLDGVQIKLYPVLPIYHYSENSRWLECPTCKIQPDKLSKYKKDEYGLGSHWVYFDKCGHCGQPILWDHEQIWLNRKVKK